MKVKKSPSHRRGDAKSTSCTCCYGAGVESPLTLLSICSACAGGRDPTYAATNSRCVRLAYRVYLARVSNSRLRSYPVHTPCKTQLAQLFCVKSIGLADFCLPCKSKRAPLLSVQQLRCNEIHLWHCGAGAQATLLMYACSLHPARARYIAASGLSYAARTGSLPAYYRVPAHCAAPCAGS